MTHFTNQDSKIIANLQESLHLARSAVAAVALTAVAVTAADERLSRRPQHPSRGIQSNLDRINNSGRSERATVLSSGECHNVNALYFDGSENEI